MNEQIGNGEQIEKTISDACFHKLTFLMGFGRLFFLLEGSHYVWEGLGKEFLLFNGGQVLLLQ